MTRLFQWWFKKVIAEIPNGVWAMFLFVSTICFILCALRLQQFSYQRIDLGIFDQVVWNTSQGRWFEFSFNGDNYLRDHRNWLLPVLAIPYRLFPTPLTLLFFQAFGTLSASIPLYFVAGRVFDSSRYKEIVATTAASIFPFYGIVLSMVMYEFHFLPFAIPLVLWFWLFVLRERWGVATIFFVLLLLLREDMPLMTAGAAITIFLVYGKQHWKKAAAYFALSVVWFFAMYWVGGLFYSNDAGTPMFFQLYHWMGQTPQEVVAFIFRHPIRTFATVFSLNHVLTLLMLAASMAFLPLFSWKYIPPILLPLFVYLFSGTEIFYAVITLHYAAPVVAWLAIASLITLRRVIDFADAGKQWWFLKPADILSMIAVVPLAFFFCFTLLLGPQASVAAEFIQMKDVDVSAYEDVVVMVQPEDTVLAMETFYPALSHRKYFLSALHTVKGREHYSVDVPYEVNQPVDWVIIDVLKLMRYQLMIDSTLWQNMHERFQKVIDDNNLVPVFVNETLVVFGHSEKTETLYQLFPEQEESLQHVMNQNFGDDIQLNSWEYERIDPDSGRLTVQLERLFEDEPEDEMQPRHMSVDWYDAEGELLQRRQVMLGYAITPIHSWAKDEERSQHIYLHHPEGAVRVTVRAGILDHNLVVPWLVAPVYDVSHKATIAIELEGLMDEHQQ